MMFGDTLKIEEKITKMNIRFVLNNKVFNNSVLKKMLEIKR